MNQDVAKHLSGLSDQYLVDLYRMYSEECWAAGFMSFDQFILGYFLDWVTKRLESLPAVFEDYELEMVKGVRKAVKERVLDD